MEKTEPQPSGFVARVRAFHDALPGWLSFSGQLSRQSFVLGLMPIFVLASLLAVPDLPMWASIPLGSPLVVVTLGLVVKRLRDAGIHWAASFVGFIPFIGWLVLAGFVALATKRPGQTSGVWKTFGTGLAAFVTFYVLAGSLVPLPVAPPASSDFSVAEQTAADPEASEDAAGGDTPPATDDSAGVESGGTAAATDEVAEDPLPEAGAPEPVAPPAPAPPVANATGGLEALVSQLRVEPEFVGGYDRDLFRHWIDADGDGCDARREVLIAESLTPVSVGARCSLSGGQWYSAFDGVVTTDASSFDIDHFVPLKEAWDSGAHGWDSGTRQRFANDLDYAGSLIAVSASSNRSKGASDPAEWLPPNRSYWCVYLVTWVEVKIRWNLSADSSEVAAIRSAGAGC
jgi:uncharacterized membrane protein YhaH (DUF805 family)